MILLGLALLQTQLVELLIHQIVQLAGIIMAFNVIKEKTKKDIRYAHFGKDNNFFGKKHTQKTKDIISKKNSCRHNQFLRALLQYYNKKQKQQERTIPRITLQKQILLRLH